MGVSMRNIESKLFSLERIPLNHLQVVKLNKVKTETEMKLSTLLLKQPFVLQIHAGH
jgi:hypothetical protein